MVGIGPQADYDTEAPSLIWVPVTEFDKNSLKDFVRNESARGRVERATDTNMAKKHAEPSFSGKMYDKIMGYFLKMAYGTLSTTTDSPEAGVNTHALSVKNDNTPNFYTIVFKDDVQTKKFVGAALNTLEITINKDMEVEYSASFISKFPEDDTQSPSYVEENIFMSRQTTLKRATNLAGLGAAAVASYESLSISINKNTSRQGVATDGNPERIMHGTVESSIDVEMVYVNDTYYDLYDNETDNAWRIAIANTDVTIGAASNPSLTQDFALAKVKNWKDAGGLDDEKRQTFSLEPDYSVSDGEMMSADLVNTQTSY